MTNKQTFQVNDIIMVKHGDFYEVEKVDDGYITISSSDREAFKIENEYIVLVCRAKDRLDMEEEKA